MFMTILGSLRGIKTDRAKIKDQRGVHRYKISGLLFISFQEHGQVTRNKHSSGSETGKRL
jgi:hypothetical protein